MRFMVVALLLAATLAGCVADEEPAQQASAPLAKPDDVGLAGSGQEPGEDGEGPTADGDREDEAARSSDSPPVDPLTIPIEGGTMLATLTQENPVAAYSFSIPAGAARPWFDGSSFEVVFLSAAPVFEEAPESMIVSVHRTNGALVASHWMVPFQGTFYTTAALGTSLDSDANLNPFTFTLDEDLAGEQVVVVVGATGLPGPAGVLLRVDDGLEVFDAPRDVDYLEDQGVWAPLALGTSTGFTANQIVELYLGLLAPVGIWGLDYVVGDVQVDERSDAWIAPHGGLRDVTVAAEATGGWGYSYVTHLAGEGAVQWSYDLEAGGHELADDGIQAWARGYGWAASSILTGLPVAGALGDGAGAAASITSTGATTNDIYALSLGTLAYDDSWEALTGEPSESWWVAYEGLTYDLETRSSTIGGATITIA